MRSVKCEVWGLRVRNVKWSVKCGVDGVKSEV